MKNKRLNIVIILVITLLLCTNIVFARPKAKQFVRLIEDEIAINKLDPAIQDMFSLYELDKVRKINERLKVELKKILIFNKSNPIITLKFKVINSSQTIFEYKIRKIETKVYFQDTSSKIWAIAKEGKEKKGVIKPNQHNNIFAVVKLEEGLKEKDYKKEDINKITFKIANQEIVFDKFQYIIINKNKEVE